MSDGMKNYYPEFCKTDIEGHRICKGCPKQDVCVSAIIVCPICGDTATRCHMESHQKSAECKLVAVKNYIPKLRANPEITMRLGSLADILDKLLGVKG